jgi:hypothetical protein
LSPRFKEHHPHAHEALLERELDEKITGRMYTRESTPLAFTVPDGCDSFEIYYGAIELNPDVGRKRDLDEIVTVGPAAVSADAGPVEGPLQPGSQLIVTVPWRAASWVELPAGRLRLPVTVRLYASGSND